MKLSNILSDSGQTARSSLALRGGSYSLLSTAILLAILVMVNVFLSVLPASWTKFDISAAQLYSVTSNTKVVLNHLEKDVTIYWIVQADQEDAILENLLSKYESLSDHIDVVKKNPDVYPTFSQQYTSEAVQNNSLVVECGERSRFIGYDDIYVTDASMYSYSYNTSFDGEGAITSAIDYVVSEELPQLYLLEGHGEAALPSTLSEQMEKENLEMQSLSLLTMNAVPEDADCVLIYAPASDISADEKDMLSDYVKAGGKLLVLAGPAEDAVLANLNDLLSYYGIKVNDGIVVETDQNHFFYGLPLALIPTMNSHAITDSLLAENYYALLPIAQGLTVYGENYGATVTELLTTSGSAFSKVDGYAMSDYEQEEEDVAGPFALALAIDDESGGQMVWFASSAFVDDSYNAYSSGANGDLVMNALSYMLGESEAMAIRSKSLNYNYLTISESQSTVLKGFLIGLIPLAYFVIGVAIIVKKRRVQNEA